MTDNSIPGLNSRRKILRDYHKNDFNNPYFNKKSKPPAFNPKIYIKIISLILVVYIFIYSDLLKINRIEVSGHDLIDRQELIGEIENNLGQCHFFILPQKNQLFFSKKKLIEQLRGRYDLNQLTIKRGWKSIAVTIQEKVSHLIVYNVKNQIFYFSDINGDVIQELSRENAEKYWDRFPILNVNEDNLKIGNEIADPNFIKFTIDLNEAAQNSGLNIQGYEKRGVNEVALVAKDGWRAYFNTQNDLKISLDNLNLVLKEKIKDPKKIQYVDLTLGDKVFIGQ